VKKCKLQYTLSNLLVPAGRRYRVSCALIIDK